MDKTKFTLGNFSLPFFFATVITDHSGNVHDSKNNCAGPSREGNLVTQANQGNYLLK
jgi:hypothetical protein